MGAREIAMARAAHSAPGCSRKARAVARRAVQLGMLGIGLSGVGFVAAIQQRDGEFVRLLLCVGPAVTWAAIGLSKSLRQPLEPTVHNWKIAILIMASILFLMPLAFRLNAEATMQQVVVVMAMHLFFELVVEKTLSSHLSLPNWTIKSPRPLLNWCEFNSGKSIGAKVCLVPTSRTPSARHSHRSAQPGK